MDKVLKIREIVREMEDEGYPTAEEVQELTKRIRRQIAAEQRRQI